MTVQATALIIFLLDIIFIFAMIEVPQSNREVRFIVALIGNYSSLGKGHDQADFLMSTKLQKAISRAAYNALHLTNSPPGSYQLFQKEIEQAFLAAVERAKPNKLSRAENRNEEFPGYTAMANAHNYVIDEYHDALVKEIKGE